MKRARSSLLIACLTFALATPVLAADLKSETVNAFNQYASLTEARIQKQVSDPKVFLYVNSLPETRRGQTLASLKQGGLYMTAMTTLTAAGNTIAIPDGLVHHWLGAVFIPGASMADVLTVVQDYNHKPEVYPDVVKSRLISRDGSHFIVSMRFREHDVITVTMDTQHDVTYTEIDPDRWCIRSYSTHISQVQDAGTPSEHSLPEGQGDGFLWRVDTFWRMLEQDGGVYLEVEAVSLSRDIPSALSWLIKPFITSVPRDSLRNTLECTRSAMLKRIRARSWELRDRRQESEAKGQKARGKR
jgi:hypothetical protein